MEQAEQGLVIVGTVVGILAVLFPIVAAAWMWKMSQKFATRGALRSAVRRFDQRMDEKVAQLERDLDRGHNAVMEAIEASREATRGDINGLGDRIAAIHETAKAAQIKAEQAHHANEMLRQEVHSINEHGTKKTAALEQQINALTNNLTLFNKLIEQGVLQAGPRSMPAPE